MPEYINHGAIWLKKTKNGDQYLTFKAERDIKEGEYINLFKKKNRTNPNHPHFSGFDVKEDGAEEEVQVPDFAEGDEDEVQF